MRLPRWIVQVGRERLSEDGKSVIVTLRYRRWHPGFWLAYLRARLKR